MTKDQIIKNNMVGEKVEAPKLQAEPALQPANPCLPIPHREGYDLAHARLRQRLKASAPQPSLKG